ncbi:MAG: aminopeptidase P family protein [Rhizobiales bacterium]|nr:aminopeptidase P family protein [Sphingomonadales bacterium]MBN9072907.1 aminopeptidase P family protein [Hyphomicrobiales bacterium]
MGLQFDRTEYERRISAARTRLQRKNLDALLVFAPESLYYLTGFDSTGFVYFQFALLTADERPLVLLTRRPDLLQARKTSIIEDVRIWYDTVDSDPSKDLQDILREHGLQGRRVGIELDSFGLRAASYEAVRARLEGWCDLINGSSVVRELRVIKSEAEIAYVRRAARLADEALVAMIDKSGPGVFEGDIAAAGASVLASGGCDPSPSGPVIGSGERALLVRATTEYRVLDPEDQITIEFAASYRHYCACLMRTFRIGSDLSQQRRMFDVTREALLAMTDAARPGEPLGAIDQAHRDVFDKEGFGASRMSACGYSLGATFRPSWMDVPPLLYAGNPMLTQPGMVLFLHAILADVDRNLAMSLGHTILIGQERAEILSQLPLEHIVR